MGMTRIWDNGWRARFDEGFDVEGVAHVAHAVGLTWAEGHPGATVLVGFGARRDSRELAEAAAETLAADGLRPVVSDAPCPVPALEWCIARNRGCVGGIMVGGGDLPADYGVLTLHGPDGGPLGEDLLQRVNARTSADLPEGRGSFERGDFTSPYRAGLMEAIRIPLISARRPKVVVDALHGPATGVLAGILASAGCEVIEIHQGVRDDFGGLHPQASDPWADECERAVVEQGADLGIVVDGDGMRSAVVDERGHMVSPHNLAPLVLGHVVRNRGKAGRVVVTLTCSMRIRWQAEQLGCEVTAVPVGFRRLHAELEEGDVLMACDEYGGICLPAHLAERDGLLAALMATELVCASGRAASSLVASLGSSLGHMDYARTEVRLDAGQAQALGNVLPGLNPAEVAGERPVLVGHADGLRLQFADGSWLAIRPSRGRPLVRACAEASTPERRDALLAAAVSLARDGSAA